MPGQDDSAEPKDIVTSYEYVVKPRWRNTAGKTVFEIMRLDTQKLAHFVGEKQGDQTRRMRVGQVYLIPTLGDETRFRFSEAKWLREYEETTFVLQWQAEQQARDAIDAAARIEAREATPDSALRAAIAPLRAAYLRLAPSQRQAFELYVLRQLRKLD